MIKQLEISNKLKECQESAKFLFGKDYNEKINWYKLVIQGYQKKHNVQVLVAVTKLCKFDHIKDNGVAQMCFMAAAVELMEND